MHTQTEFNGAGVLHLPYAWPPEAGTPWDDVFRQAQENFEFVLYHLQRAVVRADAAADRAEAAARE